MLSLLLVALVGTASMLIVTSLLGFVSTTITQFIKKAAGTSGKVALVLTVAVSFALALIATWMSGELDANNLAGSTALIFSVATLAYKTLLADDGALSVPRSFKG